MSSRSQDETAKAPRVDAFATDPHFLRSVLAASADCIKILDLQANLIFMTDEGQRIMEVSDFNGIRGCPWPDFWTGQGNVDSKAAVVEALAGREGRFQGYASTMKGTQKFWDVRVTPIFGDDGKPAQLLSVSRDITLFKVAEEQRELLMQELSHRVKNTLAMVQAIVSQTMRDDVPIADARKNIAGRLDALSGAHDILLKTNWESASLETLVEAAVSLYGARAGKIRAKGPPLSLGPKAALAFAMALHELGTNASKYGALSTSHGQVDIHWSVTDAPHPAFLFSWREVGGPPVTPPSRKGFGSRLLDRALAISLGATVDLAYHPTGVAMSITGPVSALAD